MNRDSDVGLESIFAAQLVIHDRGAQAWTPCPRALYAELLQRAASAGPVEVCGFIGGTKGRLRTVYPVRNDARLPQRRFAMAAADQLAAWRAIARRDEELLAVYHSHPDGPAYPSAADLAEHVYRQLLCVIVSPAEAGVRSFVIGAGAWEVDLRDAAS